jgi:Cu2+-exporting ATPase
MAQLDLCFKIDNVTCGGCQSSLLNLVSNSQTLKNSLHQLEATHFDMQSKTLILTVDTLHEYSQLMQVIKSLLEEDVLKESKFKINQAFYEKQLINKNPPNERFNSHQIGTILGMVLGLFWMSVSLGFVALVPWLYTSLVISSCVTLAFIAKPFFQNALQQLMLAWKTSGPKIWFNMDSLFSLTGLVVVGVSLASLFSPLFSCMLEAGFLIFGFRHLGIIFQSFLDKKLDFSKSFVSTFKDKRYRIADTEVTKAVRELTKGEVIACKQGDVVPVDGSIEWFSDGISLVDQLNNGSYFPLSSPKIEQKVLAGTVVESGELRLKIDNPIASSRFSMIDQSVRAVRSNLAPAPIMSKTQHWLQWFIPALLVLSVVSGLVVGYFFSLPQAIECFVSILVSACPCTLGLIIPMALRMGAYKASLHQVVFKSGEALQQAAQTEVVVLDYNGTLTYGAPAVKNLEILAEDKHLVYQVLMAMEKKMLVKRPDQKIGKAIQEEIARRMKVEGTKSRDFFEDDFTDFNYGASLKTREGIYFFGNNQILQGKINDLPVANRHYLLFKEHASNAFKLLATLDIEDKLRPDAKQFVDALKKRNKQVVVCTGTDAQNAQKISQELDLELDKIKAQCRFQDKPQHIQQLREQFPNKVVAMLGDGPNDVPALAASHLKIWMNNPNLPSAFNLSETANLEMHSERLMDLIHAFDISEQTFNLIYQNLSLSLTYNFLVLSVACGSLLLAGLSLHPAIGVCLMILQSALLGLNTYRTLLTPTKEKSIDQSSDLQRRMTIATS